MHKLFINLTTIILLLALNSIALAKSNRKHEAHVHGGGQLSIAFEGANGQIEFKSAAESILGFEHMPKNNSEKSLIEKMKSQFASEMKDYVRFEDALACKFTADKIMQEAEAHKDHDEDSGSGEHSDWVAQFKVICDKSPLNSELQIDFRKFKKINDIDVTLIIDDLQKSAEYKGLPLQIKLKK